MSSSDDLIDANAEAAVVASALGDSAVFHRANLSADQFAIPRFRSIWTAIRSVSESGGPIDVWAVEHALSSAGHLDSVGGVSGLSGLLLEAGTPEAADHAAAKVRDLWLRRTLATISSNLPRSGEDALSELATRLDRIFAAGSRRTRTVADHVKEEIESLGHPFDGDYGLGPTLGIEKVVPGGIPRDKVTILYGETGNLKTTTKDNLIDAIASRGERVLNFSLEDSAELTAQCFLARASGVPLSRIATKSLSKDDLERIRDVSITSLAAAKNVLVVGDVPPTIDEVIRLARQHQRSGGLAAVFIDYLQLLDLGRSDERFGLTEAVKACQRASRRDKVAYVLVSQVNEKNKDQSRPDHRPRLEDAFGARFIGHGAKLALGIFRPWKYWPHNPELADRSQYYQDLVAKHPRGKQLYPGMVEIWINKNRLGEDGVFVRNHCDLPTGKMTSGQL